MGHFLVSLQLLCLAVIVGGGLVLGGGVRPHFLKAMNQAKAANELEPLHINVWSAYNRFSLIAVLILLLVQFLSFVVLHQHHVFSFTLSIILFLLFLTKLWIDRQLKSRALEDPFAAHTSEQKKDHKQVEFLSILILALSIIGFFID
jgi:hypothetical protein